MRRRITRTRRRNSIPAISHRARRRSRRSDLTSMHVAILMPVLDDAPALVRTLEDVRGRVDELERVTVYLVDDGSDPPIDEAVLPRTREHFSIVLARHVVNLGQGAALETA